MAVKKPSADPGVAPDGTPDPIPGDSDPTPDPGTASTGDDQKVTPESLANDHAEVYEGFDPEIHAVGADGKPKRKVDGTYALKRGRKANAATALPPKNAAQGEGVGVPVKDSLIVANQMTNLFIHGTVQIFGDEWKPTEKSEAEGLRDSVKDYFDQKGVPNIPPVVGLLIAFGAYSLKRVSHENTRTKLQLFGVKMLSLARWIRDKIRGN
jgi:hypothetical protein